VTGQGPLKRGAKSPRDRDNSVRMKRRVIAPAAGVTALHSGETHAPTPNSWMGPQVLGRHQRLHHHSAIGARCCAVGKRAGPGFPRLSPAAAQRQHRNLDRTEAVWPKAAEGTDIGNRSELGEDKSSGQNATIVNPRYRTRRSCPPFSLTGRTTDRICPLTYCLLHPGLSQRMLEKCEVVRGQDDQPPWLADRLLQNPARS